MHTLIVLLLSAIVMVECKEASRFFCRIYLSYQCGRQVSAELIGGLFQKPGAFLPDFTPIQLDGQWVSEGVEDDDTGSLDRILANNRNCTKSSLCQSKPMTHEHRECLLDESSVEAFARKTLSVGKVRKWKVDKNMAQLKPGVRIIVQETKLLPGCGNNQVTCHPVEEGTCRVTFCHSIQQTKVYQVTIREEKAPATSNLINLLAVCHADTSEWEKDHASFRMLNQKPGEGPICHFMYYNDFILCPAETQ